MSDHNIKPNRSLYANTLYVVATPIGNLSDISSRAINVLEEVDVIYAEDTRQTQKLLSHIGISNKLIALHKHNEAKQKVAISDYLLDGHHAALVSDAGTPLIADPGYVITEYLHAQGVSVVPIPGCSSVAAALSVSGLPSDRFEFAGFIPAKPNQRRVFLERYQYNQISTVFFETPHRILACLEDCRTIFGESRKMFMGRELTKQFETTTLLPIGELASFVESDVNQQRGEFVLILAPSADNAPCDWQNLAEIMLKEGLSTKTISHIVSQATGAQKKMVYKYLIDSSSD